MDSQWDRPEIWLFDLHHHLFAGEAGETVAGIAALAGLFFVVSGVILWWRAAPDSDDHFEYAIGL